MSSSIPLKRTSLYDFHKKHGARMVPFAGWEMPVQYTGIIEEHKAVRKQVGLFDVSHMGEVRVEGPDAEIFLNSIMTNDVSHLSEGHAMYSLMCYSNGGVVDDLIIYRLKKDRFFICVNASNTAKDVAWFEESSDRFDCVVEDVSQKYSQLALQGPLSEKILASWLPDIQQLKRFNFKEVKIENMDVTLSRTGYTGEDGFELYFAWEKGPVLAEKILKVGESLGLKLAGLGARDSLRLEAGFPLYGHEISDKISPLEAGLDFAVKLEKAHFIGKEVLIDQKKNGLSKKIIFFKLEDRRIARAGSKIFSQNHEIGEVVSGTQSPMLNQPIGSALIKNSYKEPLFIEIRGAKIRLLPVNPPFV